jgi:transposase-like protein
MVKQKAARMRRLVAQWRQSGESQAGFARRHGIPTWTVWYWSRKASAQAVVEAATAAPAFVPIRATPETEGGVVEVVVPSGERVRVGAGASADLVRRVVAAVRATC